MSRIEVGGCYDHSLKKIAAMAIARALCLDEMLEYDFLTSEPLAVCVTARTNGRVHMGNYARLKTRDSFNNFRARYE